MVATTTATTAGTAAAVGASSAAAAGTTAGVAAGTAAGAGTAASVGAGAGVAAGAAGTAGASAGFGSWLSSMLFGEAASTGASAGTAGASSAAAGSAAAGAGSAAGTGVATTGTAAAGSAAAAGTGAGTGTSTTAGTAATEGLIGAGGEYSTKSLLANAMTGASAASAVMSGITSHRQMKANEKQTEIQYHKEKNQGLQKSNLIRETMLKDVASARAAYASRGVRDDGSPSQVIGESANQANQDIGVVQTDSQIAGLQLRGQGKEYKRAATFSLLSGFGNGAGIVGNRILRK